MSALVLFAICFGSCMAAAFATQHWVTRPAAQREREARVKRQRADRIADIETRANGCHIDDGELADWLAIETDDYRRQEGQQ